MYIHIPEGFLSGSICTYMKKSVGSLPGRKSACGEPPAKRMTGLFYPRSASLGLFGPLWDSASQPASPRQTTSQAQDRFPGRNSSSQPSSQPVPWL